MSKSSRAFKIGFMWVDGKRMKQCKLHYRTLKLYRRYRRSVEIAEKERKKMLAYAKTHGFEYCMEVMHDDK